MSYELTASQKILSIVNDSLFFWCCKSKENKPDDSTDRISKVNSAWTVNKQETRGERFENEANKSMEGHEVEIVNSDLDANRTSTISFTLRSLESNEMSSHNSSMGSGYFPEDEHKKEETRGSNFDLEMDAAVESSYRQDSLDLDADESSVESFNEVDSKGSESGPDRRKQFIIQGFHSFDDKSSSEAVRKVFHHSASYPFG